MVLFTWTCEETDQIFFFFQQPKEGMWCAYLPVVFFKPSELSRFRFCHCSYITELKTIANRFTFQWMGQISVLFVLKPWIHVHQNVFLSIKMLWLMNFIILQHHYTLHPY